MKISITGTIGSGKSEVANYLRKLGYYVFDADKCNENLLKEPNLGYLGVKKAFPDVFDSNILNKAKLAQKVFNNKDNLKILESIMHPLILEEMNKESNNKDVFFAEIPLLFESNWDKYFDYNLLIVADENTIIKRLMDKGYDKKAINERLNNQMSTDLKIQRASGIIYNKGSFSSLYKEIDNWLNTHVR